jgi:exodeoxyribonuclease VII large subunit
MADAKPSPSNSERQILSVSALAEMLQGLLVDTLPSLWVQGEISNFRSPSGHWYFTLKDAGAQIRCAMFKNRNYFVRPEPKDGDEVLIRGKVDFYTARGELQIIAEHLEPAGAGALLRAFEELKKKLSAEGLFDPKLKRPIPPAPRAIGLITSSTGAAIQDVLTTLRRRFPLGSVHVYAVPVQGGSACPAIVRALRELPRLAPVDLVIIARGGGSIEDLWCFNEERVARAIRACSVPVVTGIGHETDFTIADFAADLRAPTPTAAAELASPDQREWGVRASQLHLRLARRAGVQMQEQVHRAARLQSRLTLLHPQRRLQQHAQRLDEMLERLRRIASSSIEHNTRRVAHVGALLASFNPKAVLERGYAIVRGPAGEIVRRADSLQAGDRLNILVAEGSVAADVIQPEK